MIFHSRSIRQMGRQLLAAFLVMAVIVGGLDLHCNEAAAFTHDAGISVASVTADHGTAPASQKMHVTDHHCHGCSVAIVIDGEHGTDARMPARPIERALRVLLGTHVASPIRPPRTAIAIA